MVNLNSLLLFSDNPKTLVKFYEKVFNISADWEEGDWAGFKVGSGYISIGLHDKVKGKNKTPERMMFNLETKNVQEEFNRIEKIVGVKIVKKPYHPDEAHSMMIATFADPDGNYFQLMSPWEG
jgi:predicted enzyme related to lactoylglutathione lyase